jgi:hypothetical protein
MRTSLILGIAGLALLVQPAWAGVGRVKKVSGAATVERAGAKLPMTPGFELEKGDTIVTGKGGHVGITFNDNSRFAAGPNSRINITAFEFDDTTHQGEFHTSIMRGKVAIISGAIAKSAKDAMKVQTPTALLGVRGTKFVVEVN